jgi:site-specific DNA recombinase
VRLLKEELDRREFRSKVRVASNGVRSGGHSFYRGALDTVLRNPIYIGQIRHKGVCQPGEHEAIVGRDTWEQVQTLSSAHPVRGTLRATKSAPSPLAAKLFDEHGKHLTPSHAVKGARRYRYYVLRKLIQGNADQAHRAWRLPAAEIEGIVAGAAVQILNDHKAILDAVQGAEIASNQIPEILQSADAWNRRLESATECSSALSVLVDRVELSPDGFHLALKLPTQRAPATEAANHASIAVSRFVPMQIKRRGVELRLVVNGDRAKTQKADPALLKAIARAHRWFDDLVTGRVASMA